MGEWHEWHRNGRLAEHCLFNKYGEMVERRRWDENGDLVEHKKSGITRGL